MTVTVQTSATLRMSKGQHRTVFRNPRGSNKQYYSFYTPPPTLAYDLVYERSADGITWLGGSTAISFNGGTTWSFDIKIAEDSGNSQLVVWIVAHGYDSTAGAFQTKYVRGTIADAETIISWGAVQVIDADINDEASVAEYCIALARTDNGEIVVAFAEEFKDMGKTYTLTKLIGSDGDGASPSWSGELILVDPSGNSNNQNRYQVWFGLENYSSSYGDRVFFYGRQPHSMTATVYTVLTSVPDWDQGGAGFTNNALTLIGTPSANLGLLVSGLIDESDIPYVFFSYESSLHGRKSGTAGDDDWTGGSSQILETSGPYDALCVTLDTGPAIDEIYVFYHANGETVDFEYNISDTSTFFFASADSRTVSLHQDITALSSWNRVIENSLHIAGQYGTNVTYNEHPVYKALSTTLADLELPYRTNYLGPHTT